MPFFSRLSIQQKLIIAIIIVGSVFATVVSATAYTSARQALVDESFNAIEAVSLTRSAQIEQWVSALRLNLEAYAKNSTVATAVRAMRNAIDTSQDITVDRDERILLLRETFVGSPDLIDAVDLSSPYRSVHQRFHPFFREAQQLFGYSDVLLVSVGGDVVYSSNKNGEVFTNLLTGEFADTTLGSVVGEVIGEPSPDAVAFADFAIYPVTDEPTAFIAHAIYDSNEFLGVLVFSIPIESIEGILNLQVGIGESGQSYIVGSDRLLRTELVIPEVIGSPVLNPDVVIQSQAVEEALSGSTDVGFTRNYLDTEVLSAWRPVTLRASDTSEFVWVLVSEVSVAEAVQPANAILVAIVISLLVGAGIVLALGFLFARQISSPIIELTQAAKSAAKGEFTQVRVRTKDEVGTLTTVFNQMSSQINDLVNNLEMKVRARTRDLELAMKVSANATTELRLDKLLPEVVEQTREAFGLYHVSVYLFYSEAGEIKYTIGTGSEGEKLVAEDWHFHIHDSSGLVPLAVRDRSTVVANDVQLSDAHKSNKHLPDTKAELVVPMLVRDSIVGVLDLQAAEVDRFTNEDQRVLNSLGQQLAIAIEHAYLYEEQVEVAEELKRLDAMKSEFLARMSHELRTPLNSIINFSKFVIRRDLGDINSGQEQALVKSVNSADHLLSLINDLLDISKIEAGMMELFIEDDVNVASQLRDAAAVAAAAVEEKQVEVITEIPQEMDCIVGDRRRLNQIILNLVSNACKFTEKGEIKISGSVSDGELSVLVTDTGVGIAEEDLKLIFEPFEQTRLGAAQTAGTGLGLPISKKLVEAHGGRMVIESEFGIGSTFGFVMPAQSEVLIEKMKEEMAGEATT
ncbi:MAG: ATP-binding protein [Chloroflexota bacterium]